MSSKSEVQASSRLDNAKLWFAGLIVVTGLAGFYYFADQSLLLRVVALLVCVVASAGVALTSYKGQSLWRFMQESRNELRKVDWPTRTETVQTSLAVFAMVFIVGLMLWLFDLLLLWLVRMLTGQGG